ncbi:MAG: DUF1844 domain-containing protein [Pyrinomonadaceae bacterium]|nr:DUF1844 domain-containing protein [Pyrinomonadaceae bacterium]
MSEEQSNFKVTDRRLFNPDGTPRDIEREEETSEASTATAAQANVEPAAQTERATPPAAPAEEQSETVTAEDSSAFATPDDELSGIGGEASIPGADDPASFINFLMSIASNAASALGMMEHPVTGERGVDLQLGKHWIDILGMLQQKTRGNLHPQEQQIFEGLLSDLRMQYVSLTNTAPQKPRGFTGRDIIGGK